jgi:eukaryotic-like serine/threonine-protein kinase
MFACMVGAPPQPADQRKLNDKMEDHYRKLEAIYSRELIQVIRWTLRIDSMERPQSVFALQKALREPVPEKKNTNDILGRVSTKLKSVFNNIGKNASDISATVQDHTR